MLRPKGEVHVAHKTSHPGYNNKRGDGKRADKPFPLGECSTYKFVLFSKSSNSSKNDELCNCGPPLRRVEYTSRTKKNRNRRFTDGLAVRVSKEGSVITCQMCFEIGHNNKTYKNEPVAPPPKIAKKKGRQRMIRKLKVDMETEGGQTVGVPMPSASEMAKKTAATKHNLVVDSGRQIGAAIPSQQVTPKKKRQTGQQQQPHKLLKVKPTATIQPERRSPRLLKKTGTTSASKTTVTPPKKRTPSERIVKKKLSMDQEAAVTML